MGIDNEPIILTFVTLKLDSKKFTNSMLDQIPRLDFCELLLVEDDCFDCSPNIVPVARFSIVSFLNSQMRGYKAKGYEPDYAKRLLKEYNNQEEAFLFTYKGQLYCDSFSSKTGTLEYGNQLAKLRRKLNECVNRLASVNRVLDLEEQGFEAHEIVRKCSKGQVCLPRGRSRKRVRNILDDWDGDVLGFGESDETVASHEIDLIMKNHGSWDAYIKSIKQEMKMEQINKAKFLNDVENFNKKVSAVINEILSSPFTILGC